MSSSLKDENNFFWLRKNIIYDLTKLSCLELKNRWTEVTIWREIMLGYFSAELLCSERRTVFQEWSSSKTVKLEELIWCPQLNIMAYSRAKWRPLFIFHL